LIIVAIPEGLPLTVGISLAFSVMKMYNSDKILVRKLDAPEKMGEIEEIIIGKTGTITQADMKVAKFWCEDSTIINSRKNTILNCELAQISVERIKESILYNCDSRVEMDSTNFIPVGNPTEVGLLKFLQDADIPI
jgi:Ca2+-transporting ATPase